MNSGLMNVHHNYPYNFIDNLEYVSSISSYS